ncbi:hypothetical protein C0075_24515, partial [Rhizobium sp. KAs_5_22]
FLTEKPFTLFSAFFKLAPALLFSFSILAELFTAFHKPVMLRLFLSQLSLCSFYISFDFFTFFHHLRKLIKLFCLIFKLFAL